MPRIFTYQDFASGSEKVRTYADKHTPVIICNDTAERGKPFTVKVRIGINAKHPNTTEHHYEYIQLWNLETLLGEIRLNTAAQGEKPLHIEAEFTIIPQLSMRLTVLAYCTKHGLWRSEERYVSAPMLTE